MQSVLELSTRIAVNVEEAIDDLVDLRARLSRFAADHGAAIAAAGTHRFSGGEAAARSPTVRAKPSWRSSLGWLAARHPVSACTCTSVSARRRRRSPVLTGCASTSRSCSRCGRTHRSGEGRSTGLASTRAPDPRGSPAQRLPRVRGTSRSFERIVERGAEPAAAPTTRTAGGTSASIRGRHRRDADLRRADARRERRRARSLIQSLVATLGSAFECGEHLAAEPRRRARGEPRASGEGRARGPAHRSRRRHRAARRPTRSARSSNAAPRLRTRSAARRSSSSSSRSSSYGQRSRRAAAASTTTRRMRRPSRGGSSEQTVPSRAAAIGVF